LALNTVKKALEETGKNHQGNRALFNLVRIISILTSFLVVCVNYILGRIIRIFSSYEKHKTYSSYHISVASKLSIAMFANVAIVPLIVSLNKDEWFTNSGLVVDIFFYTLSI